MYVSACEVINAITCLIASIFFLNGKQLSFSFVECKRTFFGKIFFQILNSVTQCCSSASAPYMPLHVYDIHICINKKTEIKFPLQYHMVCIEKQNVQVIVKRCIL